MILTLTLSILQCFKCKHNFYIINKWTLLIFHIKISRLCFQTPNVHQKSFSKDNFFSMSVEYIWLNVSISGVYKNLGPTLALSFLGAAVLPPLPGFLQRPLLPKDLKLRQHEEGRKVWGGRAAGGAATHETAPTSAQGASPTLSTLEKGKPEDTL